MNVKYPLMLASILILVILISGCTEDLIGDAKDKTCGYCKDRFKSECDKCPEGVKNDYVTVDPISGECVKRCYDVAVPTTTNCNSLRDVCKQIFEGTTPSDDADSRMMCKNEKCIDVLGEGTDECKTDDDCGPDPVRCEEFCADKGRANGWCHDDEWANPQCVYNFGIMDCMYNVENYDGERYNIDCFGPTPICVCWDLDTPCGEDFDECEGTTCKADGCTV
jgi:hypothetical protein